MSELRYNPLLKTWTMVGSNRQARPHLPQDWCPFCPGSPKVPQSYDVFKYDNDFPILSSDPAQPDPVATEFYRTKPAYGKCEVILYSPDHQATLHELSVAHITKLVNLWIERVSVLSQDEKIKYVFPFENRGEEVGVTMPHPHGQIYAYSYIPQKLELELRASKEHYRQTGECLLCKINEEEKRFGRRVVFENRDFIAYLPFFTDYPYGVFISAKAHTSSIVQFGADARKSLAEILKAITGSFDRIFNRPFPFMMVMHQAPVNSEEFGDAESYFHFHIEFYPPLRAKDKIKFYASSEMGAWAAANVAAVEDTAMNMRKAKMDFLGTWQPARIGKELLNEFDNTFERGREPEVFCAPARVNLIGEHIDYNGGMVFPAALGQKIYLAIRQRADTKIVAHNLNFAEPFVSDVRAELEYTETCKWSNYLKGVMQALRERGHGCPVGFDALFYSNVPVGSGVSSSAALEVVFGYALNSLFEFGLSKIELARIGQRAENKFVAVSCGIMDQFSVALGRAGSAIMLKCDTLEYEYVPLDLGDCSLLIVNTNKERSLADSKYNERLAECRKGLEDIQQRLPDLPDLCSLTPEEFEQNQDVITQPTIVKRVRHVVTENERVKRARAALQKGDLQRFGQLMIASHISLRDDYEVTGAELDAAFEAARSVPGCLGTRMTGAGFGGCTVSIVKKDAIEEFKKEVSAQYSQKTGLSASIYVCEIGDGVQKLIGS